MLLPEEEHSRMTPVSRRMVLATTAAALAGPAVGATAAPIATTRHGKVRGAIDQGIIVFKGIRYGADTAPTRFQPPRLPEHWSGVKEALAYGPGSPQDRNEANTSEDCLFLNV